MNKSIFLIGLSTVCAMQAIPVPTCQKPLRIEKKTVIELNEDIVISSKGSPVIASKLFGTSRPAKVIFTSTKGYAVIVTSKGAWDLTSFDNHNKIVEFAGNARLICQPGATIIGNNGLLRFADSARWIMG